MRLVGMAAVGLAMFGAGPCGPKPAVQRPCSESLAARVTDDDKANGGGGYDVHAVLCRRSCEAGDEAACVEARILAEEQYWPRY